MNSMDIFSNNDQTFQVAVPEIVIRTMLEQSILAGKMETGGILIGHYSGDHKTAIVTRAEPPPPDSRWGRTWFERGVKGIQDVLKRMWLAPQRTYYLGEWHFHPFAAPTSSHTDTTTMHQEELRFGFSCQEPILIIVGGNPRAEFDLNVYVYPDSRREIQLHRRQQ